MLIFYRSLTDPYFNIAAEEYFVKHATEDLCMIWSNERSVIIGKHQNAFAEINYPFVRTNSIPVIRRISGGGAVYHDKGNINFTFIKKTNKTNQVDFEQFTSVIKKFMQSFGIEVNINKRNSLFIGDKKFSGHAEHIFHDKVLHHGTLLFNTDLDMLQKCLSNVKEYEGKAMASVRSDVGNIAPLLSKHTGIHTFIENLIEWLKNFYTGSKSYELQPFETAAIQHLAGTKYKSWEWNFGYSPAYTFGVQIPIHTGFLPVNINVKNGKFVQIDLPSDGFTNPQAQVLNSLKGILHKEEEIDAFVKNNLHNLELAGINIVYFTEAFFQY